jgi:hypothetical protein
VNVDEAIMLLVLVVTHFPRLEVIRRQLIEDNTPLLNLEPVILVINSSVSS